MEKATRIARAQKSNTVQVNEAEGTAHWYVKSESDPRIGYRVVLTHLDDADRLSSSCTCPIGQEEVCEHALAALLLIEADSNASSTRLVNRIISKALSIRDLPELTDLRTYSAWQIDDLAYKVQDMKHEGQELSGIVKEGRQSFRTRIWLTSDNELFSECNCPSDRETYPLCVHAAALLTAFTWENSSYADALFFLRDHRVAINRKLEEYGLSTEDDWEALFELELAYPKVRLVPKKNGLSKRAAFANWG
ncbi:MAG: SWIM zinc finger family protein, partial [Bacteroidota bacterium]